MVLRQKSRIKLLYKIEDKAILPKFFFYKIIYSKTYIGPNNLYKLCGLCGNNNYK